MPLHLPPTVSLRALAPVALVGLALAGPWLTATAATQRRERDNAQPVRVQGTDAAAFPTTPAGRCAKDWIALLASPTVERVEVFESAWASSRRKAARSAADRATGLAKLRDEWGDITVTGVTAGSEGKPLRVMARGSKGVALSLEFQFDSAAPERLDAILIEAEGGGGEPPRALTPDSRVAAVRGAANTLVAGYVFPEVAAKMRDAVVTKLEAGGYDAIADELALAAALTDDLRAVSKDKHLRVRFAPDRGSLTAPATPLGAPVDEMRRENYAFRKVEILPGNIGYLRFDLFVETDEAFETATAAMQFLAHCDALVIDLRNNGGGSPGMIAFLTTYLFQDRVHLNDMVDREGDVTQEYWTRESVPGRRLASDVPVFVLTSQRTFSGAEEFSYNLKNLGRATIVGETTGGGAHPVRSQRVNDRFAVNVPFMRARNPITGTNWEGTGVEPNVKSSAAEALDKASALAREAIEARRAGRGSTPTK